MTREEALKAARDHVNALATNGRGYQDGVTFTAKVDAVERTARFLLEGEPAVEIAQAPAGPKPGDRYRDRDGDVWDYRADGTLEGSSIDYIKRTYGPLTPLNGAPEL